MNYTIQAPFVPFDSYLGSLKNGQRVFDRKAEMDKQGKTLTHIHIKKTELAAALSMVEPKPSENKLERMVEFPSTIGFSSIVKVMPQDTVFWAKRVNKKGYSKFVKDRTSEPSRTISLVLVRKREKPKEWVLITAFYGDLTGPEPWDVTATVESKKYWQTHAMTSIDFTYDTDSVTYQNPW